MKNSTVKINSKYFICISPRKFYVFASIICLIIFCGCDSDPFGRNLSKITGKYLIENDDSASPILYYIVEKGTDSPGGVFEGIVKKVAWKEDRLLVDVQKLSSGDLSGWYILDIRSERITGPINDPKEIALYHVVPIEAFFENPKKFKE